MRAPDVPPRPLLEVRSLNVEFGTAARALRAVDGVDLSVAPGEVLGIVGESGSGKSVTALAAMGLIDTPGRVSATRLAFDGRDLQAMPASERRALLGADMAMIFQDPTSSLNPSFTVAFQLMETIALHEGGSRAARRARALELLKAVEIPDPERRLDAYPHQLSGGMSQRVMLAMAIACNPRLLIADEPTTALDVTVQAQMLALLAKLRAERGMALVLITHDLGVVAEVAERVLVMYAGAGRRRGRRAGDLRDAASSLHRVAAGGLARAQRRQAAPHVARRRGAGCARPAGGLPARAALPLRAAALPRRAPRAVRSRWGQGTLLLSAARAPRGRDMTIAAAVPLLEGSDLARHYSVSTGLFRPKATVRALDGVSFTLEAGRTLAVVGESGCGKSTLARQIAMLEAPSSGSLRIAGADVAHASSAEKKTLRPTVQMVFQNPFASLNPRKKIGQVLEEPLAIQGTTTRAERQQNARAMLARVGLRPEHEARYPHMFSGGQRQRIAIARALMLAPKIVVADEPVSALDVQVQAQVLNLLMDLQQETGVAYVFISHNLAVVELIADDVMVMYLGRVMERAGKATLFAAPRHPYTRALLASTPRVAANAAVRLAQASRTALGGELPSPLAPPSGCVFRTRCPHAIGRCAEVVPPLEAVGAGHAAACIRLAEIG